MKNDHGVDAFYFHDKLGQVLRDLGSYKADELARALCRLAKVADENVLKEPEFAQHPAMAVPDGWKLVPFHATREQVNAVFMHPDLARTLYRNMVEAAPAAPVAVGRDPVARAFGKVCGGDAEHNTVNVRVSGPVPPELWTIGTAVALYAAPAAAEQPDTVKVQRELIARLDRMYSEGMSINPELEELRSLLAGGEA